MDFELDESQTVIAASAARVLGRQTPAARSADGEQAWQALAKAGLLALTLPGRLDGDELGVLDAAVLLTEIGRRAVSVPALATIMLGALPVTRWGSEELQDRVLAGVGAGEVILTAAIREPSEPMPARPATAVTAGTVATAGTGVTGGTVTGLKVGVMYADEARWLLVPASTPDGDSVVAIISRTAPGLAVTGTPASGVVPEYTVRLDAAPVAGVLGAGAVDDLYQLAAAGAAALADGALAGALDLTSGYVAQREQFGRPLATFQAVAQQIADIYITSRTLHLAALSACWRLATGRAGDAEVAAYWLAQEAPAALRSCHHLHGGIGLDLDYPLHRYSAMISDLARFVGGAAYRLDLLAGA